MKNSLIKKILVFVIVLLLTQMVYSTTIYATDKKESDSIEIISRIHGTIGLKEERMKISKQQLAEIDNLFDDINNKLDATTNRIQAIRIIYKSLLKLSNLGLLPKGVNIKQVHQLITGNSLNYLNIKLLNKDLLKQGPIVADNTNCLIIGRTNWTCIRPYPVWIDLPKISRFIHNRTILSQLFVIPIMLRILIPFRFNTDAYIGGRYRLTLSGNITRDVYSPAYGWIWTNGANGTQKWDGKFYGSLRYIYKKSVNPEPEMIGELWDPIGIEDFTGLTFNFIGKIQSDIKQSYIGFARQVSFNYSYPWT
jgi:hypothetical protein